MQQVRFSFFCNLQCFYFEFKLNPPLIQGKTLFILAFSNLIITFSIFDFLKNKKDKIYK